MFGWTLDRRAFISGAMACFAPHAIAAADVDDKVAGAVKRGLDYLARQQSQSAAWPGSWGERGNVAVTSVAAMALASNGRFPERGPEGRPVALALDFLLSQAQVSGLIANPMPSQRDAAYGHGFATTLLAELLGMVLPKGRADRVGEVLERGVRLLVAAQSEQGGWRYELQPREESDVSVTVTQLMALRAAIDADIHVAPRVFERGLTFLQACQVLPEGGFRYQPHTGPMGFPLTAAGLVGLHCCGRRQGPEIDAARQFLLSYQPDKPNRPVVNPDYLLYGHYYAALALKLKGGDAWTAWHGAVANQLVSQQRSDGSWPDAKFGDHYATAMACLILQTPRSCLPLLRP